MTDKPEMFRDESRNSELYAQYMQELERLVLENERLKAKPSIDECIAHRCMEHRAVPPLNANENGSECGACIASDPDEHRYKWVMAQQERADNLEAKLKAAEMCKCGHTYAMHCGHTQSVDGPIPQHCAAACFCRRFNPQRIGELEAQLKEANSWKDQRIAYIEDLEAQLAEKPCTCGSGGHPEKCDKHPQAFDLHVMTLNYENGQREIDFLEQRLGRYREALEAIAKPALGGKVQQWRAREALRDGEKA